MLINKLSYIPIKRLKQFSHFRKLFSHFRLQWNIFLPYLIQQFQPQSNQCVHSHRYLYQNSAEQLDCSGPDFQQSTCPSPGEQMNITQTVMYLDKEHYLPIKRTNYGYMQYHGWTSVIILIAKSPSTKECVVWCQKRARPICQDQHQHSSY